MNRRSILRLCLPIVAVVVFLVLTNTNYMMFETTFITTASEELEPLKTILLWTPFFESKVRTSVTVSQSEANFSLKMRQIWSGWAALKKTTYYLDMLFQDWYFGTGQDPFNHCPVPNCYVTYNRTHLKNTGEYDAVLFHIRNLAENITDFPHKEARDQSQVLLC